MLDSGATHSFVYPRMAPAMQATTLKGARLTVTVANGTTVVYDDVIGVGLTFSSGGET